MQYLQEVSILRYLYSADNFRRIVTNFILSKLLILLSLAKTHLRGPKLTGRGKKRRDE